MSADGLAGNPPALVGNDRALEVDESVLWSSARTGDKALEQVTVPLTGSPESPSPLRTQQFVDRRADEEVLSRKVVQPPDRLHRRRAEEWILYP